MSRFEKWSVWVTSALTGLTGVGYLWIKYFVEPSDPFAVVNHPLQPWLLKAHILVSPFLLLAFGMILTRHVWKHFRNRLTWGRKSGILSALLFIPMVVTGYLIQSVTSQGWLEALAIAHIVAGCVYLLGLAAHQIAIYFMQPPPEKRRLYPLDRRRRRVGRSDEGGSSSDAPEPTRVHPEAGPEEEASRERDRAVSVES